MRLVKFFHTLWLQEETAESEDTTSEWWKGEEGTWPNKEKVSVSSLREKEQDLILRDLKIDKATKSETNKRIKP